MTSSARPTRSILITTTRSQRKAPPQTGPATPPHRAPAPTAGMPERPADAQVLMEQATLRALLRELPNVVLGLMVMLRRCASRCEPGKRGLVGVRRLGG